LNQKSIYKQFYQKLIFATTAFVIVISFIFYGFTKATIYEDISQGLLNDAKLIYKISQSYVADDSVQYKLITKNTYIDLIQDNDLNNLTYNRYKVKNDNYIEILYPFDKKKHLFIKISKNINNSNNMLNKIFTNMLILGLGGMIMVVLYAFAVSKTLLEPILNITNKLSLMDENSLTKINVNKLPKEFNHLAISINSLTTRIENYIKYQKELFIGTAHELKTPLAVMKLKSEVILKKPREIKEYTDTLKLHISEIDKMNNMISSILDMGRQESAQFEKPIKIDIINFLQQKINDYKLLSKSKFIKLDLKVSAKSYITIIQPNLFNQIIQNFVQNAIKFTHKNENILIDVKIDDDILTIKVIDGGIGINENIDLFAPFKRVGDKGGAGLGLFLAKSASDTLGAQISLKNRGKKGAVASLKLANHKSIE
jgi:two-component system OmpR family sensor kinase